LSMASALAADYPTPQHDWNAPDFGFRTGEVFPSLHLHYTTVGDRHGEPVLILHGTAQSAAAMLTPYFAGELFGTGQALNATKYFIILPDALGAGGSARPSEGLRASSRATTTTSSRPRCPIATDVVHISMGHAGENLARRPIAVRSDEAVRHFDRTQRGQSCQRRHISGRVPVARYPIWVRAGTIFARA
jgi:hypothetical protein